MEDLPGLFLRPRVVDGSLQLRERVQHPDGQRGVEGQGHPGGQQGVAPEQRHEPRRSSGDHDAVGVGAIDDAQPGEISERLVDHRREAWIVGDDRGHLGPPLGQPTHRDGVSRRDVAGEGQAGPDAVGHGLDRQADGRLRAGWNDEVPGERAPDRRRPDPEPAMH